MTDVSAYFAQIYADSSDPWQYEKRWYEVRNARFACRCCPTRILPRRLNWAVAMAYLVSS